LTVVHLAYIKLQIFAMPMKRYSGTNEYIADQPKESQAALEKLHALIIKLAPEVEERTDITAPTYNLNGKRFVFFHVLKDKVGFYPDPATIDHFKKELGDFMSTKGAVNFPVGEDIPYDLIEKMTKYRLEQMK